MFIGSVMSYKQIIKQNFTYHQFHKKNKHETSQKQNICIPIRTNITYHEFNL
jgi:hypothetical protein